MLNTNCLPREILKEYLSGWADPQAGEDIEAHLRKCPTCEQTLCELESNPDTLCEWLRESATPSSTEREAASLDPTLGYAMERAKRIVHETTSQAASWQPSTTLIGPYELLKPLGHGGMGTVYLARHRQLGKQVAIKLLPSRPFRNDHYAARFQREIRAAGQLNHRAIVSSTDAGMHDSTHYLVMEFIDGLDLSQVARLLGPLPIAEACAMMQSVAMGLSHAHAQGIVHRDIKPSNLMLGSSGEVKILDFGLAQVSLWDEVSAELTTVGQLMGTLDYMAPEQAERADAVDYRADLYSLGATLFRLLCGQAPLAAAPKLSPLAKLRLLSTDEPPQLNTLRPDAPPKLVALMKQLLARQPQDRPASAAHVSESLAPFAQGADLNALLADAQTKRALLPSETSDSFALESVFGSLGSDRSGLADSLAEHAAGAGQTPPRWRRWLVAGLLLPCILLAGVLITLELQKGQLVIESEGANVQVNLLRDGKYYEQMSVLPGISATRMYAGKYEVVIDQGSDRFTVDRNKVEITRGGTTVVKITTGRNPPSAGLAKNKLAANSSQEAGAVPPASDAKLRPGDRLQIRCLVEPILDMQEVAVAADYTIKLRIVGVVNVKDFNTQQLEDQLNEHYKRFYNKPGIEVFRDLSNGAGLASASLQDSEVQSP